MGLKGLLELINVFLHWYKLSLTLSTRKKNNGHKSTETKHHSTHTVSHNSLVDQRDMERHLLVSVLPTLQS